MNRPACIALAIALLPVSSGAQTPTASGRTHTVRSGDTLSGLAVEYYGAASEWPRIFESNRDRVGDPDLIQVGILLTIPGSVPTEPSAAAITSVQVGNLPVSGQDILSYEARRALLESRPLQPMGTPEVPPGDRSVFFDVPEQQGQAAIVVLEGIQLVPAFPASVFHSAGWLVRENDAAQGLGQVVGFPARPDASPEATSGLLYEDVYVRLSSEAAVQLGDEFLTYEFTRTLDGIGQIAAPSGRVRVTEIGDGEVVAQIVQAFARVEAGHFVRRAPDFPLQPGVRPVTTDQRLETRILGMQEPKEIYLPGDFAIVAGGRDLGLALGDELIGLSGNEADWTGREFARFQVVGLQEEFATVRIISALIPPAVRPGLLLLVDRKMP